VLEVVVDRWSGECVVWREGNTDLANKSSGNSVTRYKTILLNILSAYVCLFVLIEIYYFINIQNIEINTKKSQAMKYYGQLNGELNPLLS